MRFECCRFAIGRGDAIVVTIEKGVDIKRGSDERGV